MGEAKTEAREVREKLDDLKKDIADLAKVVKDEAAQRLAEAKEKIVGRSGDWLKERPAATLGIVAGVAACVGFVLGLLAGRGRG